MDRVLDEEPRPRQADLPRVVVLVHGLLHGRVEVGVREDQEGCLAAELEGDRREVRAGRGGDELPGVDRAGERDPAHVGMGDERRAGLLADPLNHVEGAVGHPGVACDVGEERGGERRPLGWLRDHGVPGRERGRDAPRREHQRRVPRRDHDGDPGGVPAHVVRVTSGVEVVEGELVELVGEEAEVVPGAGDHGVRHRAEEGAVVAGLDLGDVGSSFLDQLPDAADDLGALLGRHRAPGLETLLGCVHRACGFVLAASSDLGDRRLVDRRDVAEGRAGRDALTADPMVGRDLDAFDLDAPAQCRPPSDSFVSERYGGR